jgi:hypothetical protein
MTLLPTMLAAIAMLIFAGDPPPQPPSYSLTIQPLSATVGMTVTFIFRTNDTSSNFFIDYGDGSPTEPVVIDETMSHEFTRPGTYDVAVLVNERRTMQTATIVISPAPHVVDAALMWPGGAAYLNLKPGAALPQPVTIVRVDGPGVIDVRWDVDGNTVATTEQQSFGKGVLKFVCYAALPRSGSHQVSATVLPPVQVDEAQQPLPITYAFTQ